MQIEMFRSGKDTSQVQPGEGWTLGYHGVWQLMMRGISATDVEPFVEHVNKY